MGIWFARLVPALVVAIVGCNAGGLGDNETAHGDAAGATIELVDTRDAAPAWTIGYGDEFWRRSAADVEVAPARASTRAPISSELNLGDVIDRVSHAIEWRRDASGASQPRVSAATYRATFDGAGLRFSPHRVATDPTSLVNPRGLLVPQARQVPVVSAATPPGRAPAAPPASRAQDRDAPRTSAVQADPSTELRVRTARVSFGGREIFQAGAHAVPWSVLGNTAQGLLDASAGVVEHYEARADGVELTWVVRDRGAVGGELGIEVALEGLTYLGRTAGGVHFGDGRRRARVRIGAAELVDARGQRWPVATELIDGGARWRIGRATLGAAAFPIALDPMIGPEFGMDEPLPAPAATDQYTPAVASNGSDYFVAWHDERNGAFVTDGCTRVNVPDIYGTRVTAAGVVLDPSGLRLSTGQTRQYFPSVASNGTDYLVAWQDWRNYATGSVDIYGTRVTAAGVVQDPSNLALSTGPGAQTRASVASVGTDYLVAWSDDRNAATTSTDVYGTRVTAMGVVQDTGGLALSTAPGAQDLPRVGSNGTAYLVVWQDGRNMGTWGYDVYGTRVTAAGVVQDATGLALSNAPGDQYVPSVASAGTDYLVVWGDGRNMGKKGYDVYGTRVTAAGVVQDATGLALSNAFGNQYTPSIGSNGTDYLVVWMDLRDSSAKASDIYGTRVTAAGVVQDAAGLAISTAPSAESTPAVASNGADYFVTWTDYNASASVDIYGARVAAGGAVQAGIALATGPNTQYRPAAASNGSDYLVVWVDDRNGTPTGSDIYGARVTAAGVVQDASGLAISTAPGRQLHPSVASNGTDYFVVWQDDRNWAATSSDIYGTRVTAAGVVQDATGLALSLAGDSQRVPSIASDGTDYLVVWQDLRNVTAKASDIYGTRVTASGVVQDAMGRAVCSALESQTAPSVASDGIGYLVAWQDTRNTAARADIYGARMTAAGVVQDAGGFAISDTTQQYAPWQHDPSVASNGTGYLVVWNGAQIVGTRVTAAGVVQDAGGLAISNPTQSGASLPSVASNGIDYLVAWQGWYNYATTNIYGSVVTVAGVVEDPGGVAFSTGLHAETRPRVAGNRSTRGYLVAYESRLRVAARLIHTTCGDGTVQAAETCDDGNNTAGDGCASCSIEGGYTCSGTPSSCADVDECAQGTDNCATGATCTNLPGSFSCTCNAGYAGDGVTCADLDECALGTANCAVGATCTNLLGGFLCTCNAGYAGDGVTCADLDECALGTDNCAADATCANRSGGFHCACNWGYAGDGVTCTDLDECALSADSCAEHATCTNVPGSYECTCVAGYVSDGTHCVASSEDDGCGCRTSHPGSSLLLALTLCLALRRRRR